MFMSYDLLRKFMSKTTLESTTELGGSVEEVEILLVGVLW